MDAQNPIDTANNLREVIAMMIEGGIYTVDSLNDLLMPMYNAEVEAGRMNDTRAARIGKILEQVKPALRDNDDERRLQLYLALLEILTERSFSIRKGLGDISRELSPHNAKIWNEMQENYRQFEEEARAGRLPQERIQSYRDLWADIKTSFDENVKKKRQLKEFRVELESDVEKGKIKPQRALRLRSILNELDGLLDAPLDDDGEVIQAREMRYRELLSSMSGALAEPSGKPAYEEGTRAAIVDKHLGNLKLAYIEELTRPGILEGEKSVLDKEGATIVSSIEVLEKNPGDADVIELERETIRQAALELKQYRLRHHLTALKPVWQAPKTLLQDPNAVFFSGTSKYHALVKSVCRERGLAVMPEQHTGTEFARFRWQQLWTSHFAIFDLTNYERDAPLEKAVKVAAVCYELGMAFACGRSSIVLARDKQPLPFDIDIAPCILRDDDDAESLGEAIDAALYSTQRGTSDSSLDATISYAQEILGGKSNWFKGKLVKDPVQARRLLQKDFMGETGIHLVSSPAWPGSYPDEEKPRCFHVMPFREELEWTVAAIEDLCQNNGLIYIRGDQVLEPDIIRSIWDEICCATHIVVEMTGMNPNVLLELGMAHTLGRNVILVTQDDFSISTIPSLAKIRLHRYSRDGTTNLSSLETTLAEFLYNENISSVRRMR